MNLRHVMTAILEIYALPGLSHEELGRAVASMLSGHDPRKITEIMTRIITGRDSENLVPSGANRGAMTTGESSEVTPRIYRLVHGYNQQTGPGSDFFKGPVLD